MSYPGNVMMSYRADRNTGRRGRDSWAMYHSDVALANSPVAQLAAQFALERTQAEAMTEVKTEHAEPFSEEIARTAGASAIEKVLEEADAA